MMKDWQKWIAQRLPRTEIMRGGATAWPKDSDRLIGDTLGPVMHLHDAASEIFFFRSGRTRLEVGDRDEIFEAGDFALVPPETPHNFHNGGEEDVCVFWLVAPHFFENKWRTEAITPAEMRRGVVRAHISREDGRELKEVRIEALPSDANIAGRLIRLPPRSVYEDASLEAQEAVIYVLDGPFTVQVGRLNGPLPAEEFVHVPASQRFSLRAEGHPGAALIFKMPGAG